MITLPLFFSLILAMPPYQAKCSKEIPVQTTDTYNREELDKISRKIVDNLAARKYENVRADFAEELKNVLSAEKIGQVWESIILQIGEFQKITSTENKSVNGLKQIIHKCNFERNNMNVEVTFSSNNKVIALYIKP